MATMADRIKQLRKKNKLTQEKMGRLLNIDRSVISKWETGFSSPKIEQLQQISDTFKVPVSFLIDGEETEENNKKNNDYILAVILITILSFPFSPFLILFNIACIYISIRKKMGILVILFCIAGLLYSIDTICFLYGIEFLPTITIVS